MTRETAKQIVIRLKTLGFTAEEIRQLMEMEKNSEEVNLQMTDKKFLELSKDELMEEFVEQAFEAAFKKLVERKANQIVDHVFEDMNARFEKHSAEVQQRLEKLLVDKLPV